MIINKNFIFNEILAVELMNDNVDCAHVCIVMKHLCECIHSIANKWWNMNERK